MDRLPQHMLHEITDCLSYGDVRRMSTVARRFALARLRRRVRLRWTRRRVIPRYAFRDGFCADTSCMRRKSACIRLDPVSTVVLSNYCQIHTNAYLHHTVTV